MASDTFDVVEAQAFGLNSGVVLDTKAVPVIDLLLEKYNVIIPPAIAVGHETSSSSRKYRSVYHQVADSNVAEILFKQNFRDTDALNSHGLPPLVLTAHPRHGADPLRRLDPNAMMPYDLKVKGATVGHFVLRELGTTLDYRLPFNNLSLEELSAIGTLTSRILAADIADACYCKCSLTSSCSSFNYMLQALVERWVQVAGSPNSLAHAMVLFFNLLGLVLEKKTLDAAIRFLTFQELDIVHTCTHTDEWSMEEFTTEDIQEIHHDESESLELLEELVKEFGSKVDELLENDLSDKTFLQNFWIEYWAPRMNEALASREGNDLTEEGRTKAEEIGVIWKETSAVCDNPRKNEGIESMDIFNVEE